MNAAILCGRLMRRLSQHSRRVLQRCNLSSSSDTAQMYASLHQFTDDECMMRDTGQHLLQLTSTLYLDRIISHLLFCSLMPF